MQRIFVKLSGRNFQAAVGHIMREDPLKRKILRSVSNQINKKCSAAAKDKSFMHVKKVKDISKFSFDDIQLTFTQSCPFTYACLSAIARRTKPRKNDYSGMRFIAALSVLLFEKNQHVSLFQKAMSILLYNGQLQTEVCRVIIHIHVSFHSSTITILQK